MHILKSIIYKGIVCLNIVVHEPSIISKMQLLNNIAHIIRYAHFLDNNIFIEEFYFSKTLQKLHRSKTLTCKFVAENELNGGKCLKIYWSCLIHTWLKALKLLLFKFKKKTAVIYRKNNFKFKIVTRNRINMWNLILKLVFSEILIIFFGEHFSKPIELIDNLWSL